MFTSNWELSILYHHYSINYLFGFVVGPPLYNLREGHVLLHIGNLYGDSFALFRIGNDDNEPPYNTGITISLFANVIYLNLTVFTFLNRWFRGATFTLRFCPFVLAVCYPESIAIRYVSPSLISPCRSSCFGTSITYDPSLSSSCGENRQSSCSGIYIA